MIPRLRDREVRRPAALALAIVLHAGLTLAAALPAALPAAARAAPDGFADLAQDLTPAVVNVSTLQLLGPEPDGQDPAVPGSPPGGGFEEYYDYFLFDDVPEDFGGGGDAARRITSLGSGFIIDREGHIVTNDHVIAEADEIVVGLDDGTWLRAAIVGRDAETDLALLKVEAGRPLPFVVFGDSDRVRVGDWIIAIGNPFGLGNTVTAGIISARGRNIDVGPYDDFLQTDAPINRGNSGGPMFDMKGEVVGVNTLIFSPSGGSVGIGFATPSALVRPVIEQLKSEGRVRRGWLGMRIQPVGSELAAAAGLAPAAGAVVASVNEGGPAAQAGLRPGDVIVAFGGVALEPGRLLPRFVAEAEIGAEVEIEIWRDGERRRLEIRIGEADDGL